MEFPTNKINDYILNFVNCLLFNIIYVVDVDCWCRCFHSIFHFIYFITFSLLMHPPDNKGIKLTAKIVNEYAARYKRWICRKEPGGGGHLGIFAGYVPLACQSRYPIIVYSVWANM